MLLIFFLPTRDFIARFVGRSVHTQHPSLLGCFGLLEQFLASLPIISQWRKWFFHHSPAPALRHGMTGFDLFWFLSILFHIGDNCNGHVQSPFASDPAPFLSSMNSYIENYRSEGKNPLICFWTLRSHWGNRKKWFGHDNWNWHHSRSSRGTFQTIKGGNEIGLL